MFELLRYMYRRDRKKLLEYEWFRLLLVISKASDTTFLAFVRALNMGTLKSLTVSCSAWLIFRLVPRRCGVRSMNLRIASTLYPAPA